MGESEHVPAWKLRARAKRVAQATLIPTHWRLKEIPEFTSARDYIRTSGELTSYELEITEIIDARVLQELLQTKQLTALAVATAYCKRAAVAQQLTGCLTEIFFKRALARAQELDEYFEKEGKPIGPLHGIPISFKDNYDVEGLDSTIGEFFVMMRREEETDKSGWVGLIGKPAARNSLGVDLVLRLGAVIYVKVGWQWLNARTLANPHSRPTYHNHSW